VLFAWALWEARDWGFRASLFPWVIGFVGLPLVVIQFGLDLRRFIKLRLQEKAVAPRQGSSVVTRSTMTITCWILGYFVALWSLGFSVAVPLVTALYLKVAGERWFLIVPLTFSAWGLYYMFSYFLHVPFPEGLLLSWVGI
jgi:hypothetical protein